MKPGTPSLQSTRLLDQVGERVLCSHYNLKKYKDYIYYIIFHVCWSATQPSGMRHPRDMSVAEV